MPCEREHFIQKVAPLGVKKPRKLGNNLTSPLEGEIERGLFFKVALIYNKALLLPKKELLDILPPHKRFM